MWPGDFWRGGTEGGHARPADGCARAGRVRGPLEQLSII